MDKETNDKTAAWWLWTYICAGNSKVIHNSQSEEGIALKVDKGYTALAATQEQVFKLATERAKDANVKKVMRNLRKGRKKGPWKQYDHIWSGLSVVDSPLLKGDRIVERASICRKMLARIHKGHLGAEKSRTNMNSGIDQLVPICVTRQEHHYKLTKEVLVSRAPMDKSRKEYISLSGQRSFARHRLPFKWSRNTRSCQKAVKGNIFQVGHLTNTGFWPDCKCNQVTTSPL